jgi:molybdopterin-guanine dinucleotide biosynthesis protein A
MLVDNQKEWVKTNFFLQLNGKTLIEHSIDKVKKHLQKVIIIKNLEFEIKDYDPFININPLEDLEFAKK